MAQPKTDATGQIQKRTESAPARTNGTLADFLGKMLPEITRALPKHMNPDRMARITLTALRTVPKLGQCTIPSFAGCVMQLAQLGLEPNTPLGHAYLVPRKNSRASRAAGQDIIECTMIPGYKGYIELARRAGVSVKAEVVYEDDIFRRTYGLEPMLIHEPNEDPQRTLKQLTHAYAVARGRSLEEPVFEVLDRAQVEFRMNRSSDQNHTIWKSDTVAMWRKSAVRALVSWSPLSVEVNQLQALDVAADTGSQGAAFDPMVAEALSKNDVELPMYGDDDDAPALTSGDERLDELRNAVENGAKDKDVARQ